LLEIVLRRRSRGGGDEQSEEVRIDKREKLYSCGWLCASLAGAPALPVTRSVPSALTARAKINDEEKTIKD